MGAAVIKYSKPNILLVVPNLVPGSLPAKVRIYGENFGQNSSEINIVLINTDNDIIPCNSFTWQGNSGEVKRQRDEKMERRIIESSSALVCFSSHSVKNCRDLHLHPFFRPNFVRIHPGALTYPFLPREQPAGKRRVLMEWRSSSLDIENSAVKVYSGDFGTL